MNNSSHGNPHHHHCNNNPIQLQRALRMPHWSGHRRKGQQVVEWMLDGVTDAATTTRQTTTSQQYADKVKEEKKKFSLPTTSLLTPFGLTNATTATPALPQPWRTCAIHHSLHLWRMALMPEKKKKKMTMQLWCGPIVVVVVVVAGTCCIIYS